MRLSFVIYIVQWGHIIIITYYFHHIRSNSSVHDQIGSCIIRNVVAHVRNNYSHVLEAHKYVDSNLITSEKARNEHLSAMAK